MAPPSPPTFTTPGSDSPGSPKLGSALLHTPRASGEPFLDSGVGLLRYLALWGPHQGRPLTCPCVSSPEPQGLKDRASARPGVDVSLAARGTHALGLLPPLWSCAPSPPGSLPLLYLLGKGGAVLRGSFSPQGVCRRRRLGVGDAQPTCPPLNFLLQEQNPSPPPTLGPGLCLWWSLLSSSSWFLRSCSPGTGAAVPSNARR